MNILYFTDNHGRQKNLKTVEKLVDRFNIHLIIDGGDVCPKGARIEITQEKYLTKIYLPWANKMLAEHGVKVLSQLGNDDLEYLDIFCPTINTNIDDISIVSSPMVQDIPFLLKDRVLPDNDNSVPKTEIGLFYDSSRQIYKSVDWEKHYLDRGTLKYHLEQLPVSDIYVLHQPPNHLGLARLHDNADVGSQAVYDFLKQRQPILCLSGHIHESSRDGHFKAKIGNTLVVQPGQSLSEDAFNYCLIELDEINKTIIQCLLQIHHY